MRKTALLILAGTVLAASGLFVYWATRSPQSNQSPPTNIPLTTNLPTQTQKPFVQSASDRYIDYSPSAYAQTAEKKRVLFFKASWCPTCNAANKDYTDNLSSIPEDVVILKVDYDKETELKKQYGITYQHTFVQVDKNGNSLTKWNGGGVNELLANLR
ncbi:MAG: thioredoxin family protein [bacterium]|nr:thioredoxin family protein [bacterium]